MTRPTMFIRPRTSSVVDVICLAFPEHKDPEDPKIIDELDNIAWQSVRAQWGRHARVTLTDTRVEWLITGEVEKVEEFQPAHDCEQCHKGNAKAREFLLANPGAKVALGNVYYTENWPEYDLTNVPEDDRSYVINLLDTAAGMPIEGAMKMVESMREAGDELARATEVKAKGSKWKTI